MTHGEKGAKYFSEGYNCCQSVVLAYAEDCSIDEALALKLSSSFGGGMGRLREVCGAVTGMFIVAGILKGYSDPTDKAAKDEHYKLIQSLSEKFTSEYGTYICRDLLKRTSKDSPISSPRTKEYYKTRPCVRFVMTACDILEELI